MSSSFLLTSSITRAVEFRVFQAESSFLPHRDDTRMTRGNQRDRDRERADARNPKAKVRDDGLTPEQRRERDAKALQEKAAKKAAAAAGAASGNAGGNKGSNKK